MGQARATRAEGTPDLVITGAVVLDHWGVVKADVGVRDGRIVALGKAGNPDTMDGVHPELVIGPSTEIVAGNGHDPHRRRRRLPRPPHLPDADPGGARIGRDHLDRRRHGPGGRDEGDHRDPRRLVRGADAGVARRLADQRRAARQGQHRRARGAARAGADRDLRVQAARGLGVDAGGDRRLPAGGRPDRRAGGDPHRHAERGRLRPGHPRRDRRAGDPRLPHRGCGRRARARHHHGGRAAARAAVVDEPDPAAHRQHRRRAPRHAHGLPPPQADGAGGPGVRRVAHPPVDDRGRGPAARPRGDLDDRLGLAGHGPGRRGAAADLADRARRARSAGARCPATVRRTTCGPSGTSRSTRSARRSRTASTPRSARSRSGKLADLVLYAAGVLRGAAVAGDQGRDDRLRGDGRRQRVDPHAAAGAAAADVRGGRR